MTSTHPGVDDDASVDRVVHEIGLAHVGFKLTSVWERQNNDKKHQPKSVPPH